MSFECSLSLTAYLWNLNEIRVLIQPDGLLGGLDKHIEYLLSRTAYCVVGPVWRNPRVFEYGRGVSSQTCAAQPPSASGDDLGFFDLDLYGAAPECVGWRLGF